MGISDKGLKGYEGLTSKIIRSPMKKHRKLPNKVSTLPEYFYTFGKDFELFEAMSAASNSSKTNTLLIPIPLCDHFQEEDKIN